MAAVTLSMGMTALFITNFALGQESEFSEKNFSTDFKTIVSPKKNLEVDTSGEKEKANKDAQKQPTAEELKARNQQELKSELAAQLVGAWAFVSLVNEPLTNDFLRRGARRCIEPMQLKNLKFENSAKKALPDISGLYGDVIYFPTEAGLQRLDVESGTVLLITQFAKQERSPDKIIWGIRGEQFGVRLRFSKQTDNANKARLVLEEGRLLLRCPLKGDPFDTGE